MRSPDGVDAGSAAGIVGSTAAGAARTPSFAVKWKVAPRPASLSSQRRPPIISTKRREMVKPSPVPPWLRAVDPSACVNASKMAACRSFGTPVPVPPTRAPLPILRPADAGVGRADVQQRLVAGPLLHVHRHDHAALLGELERVS